MLSSDFPCLVYIALQHDPFFCCALQPLQDDPYLGTAARQCPESHGELEASLD